MGVWADLGSAATHARLLTHPLREPIGRAIAKHVADARAIDQRQNMRQPQEQLLASLLEAEHRYSEESRLSKRGEGNAIDLLFWRRTCVQLRAVGDALAWKFLAYDRRTIVLLGQNQRPGLLLGKAGTEAEWQACNAHWDEGRPALLTGITNCITTGDLLVEDGDTLLINEVKRGSRRCRARSATVCAP